MFFITELTRLGVWISNGKIIIAVDTPQWAAPGHFERTVHRDTLSLGPSMKLEAKICITVRLLASNLTRLRGSNQACRL